MKNLFDTLKTKQRELQELRRQHDKLDEEVRALQIAARVLSEGDEGQQSESKTPNSVQMVRTVLQEKATPMHMADIADAIRKKFGKKIDATVMTAVVYRYSKRNKTFFKHKEKPNTWGLLEWEIAKNPELPLQAKAVQ